MKHDMLIIEGKVAIPIGTSLEDARRKIVLSTLAAFGNNQTRAAAILGISRMTLSTLLRRYGMPRRSSLSEEAPVWLQRLMQGSTAAGTMAGKETPQPGPGLG